MTIDTKYKINMYDKYSKVIVWLEKNYLKKKRGKWTWNALTRGEKYGDLIELLENQSKN